MSCAMNLITGNVPAYVPTEGRCLQFSGNSAATVNLSTCSSHTHYKPFSKFTISLNRSSKTKSYICRAVPGGYRRNPDFSRQNNQGFSRRTNQQDEEGDDMTDQLEYSESFTSKNGPPSGSNNSERFQAKAIPGPREKEIVELFRKVQAKLRQRSGDKNKEDRIDSKKIEESHTETKKGETVDSLLDLLRKHSVSKGRNNNNTRDFGFDQSDRKYSARFGSNNVVKQDFKESKTSNNAMKPDIKESEVPFSARPTSNFQKRSPITRTKYKPTYVDKEIININGKIPESFELVAEKKPQLDPESDAIFANGVVFDDMIVEYANSDDDDEHDEEDDDDEDEEDDDDEEEDDDDDDEDDDDDDGVDEVEEIDLSGLKVTELRAIAKSRGMKGFSKLKKVELLELLSGGSD